MFWDMDNVVIKVESIGNEWIMLIECGIFFGYNMLVVDM